MLAMGSYGQTIAIYSEDNMELLYVLHGHDGGITQVSKIVQFLLVGILYCVMQICHARQRYPWMWVMNGCTFRSCSPKMVTICIQEVERY
jgi:hypothetical protein